MVQAVLIEQAGVDKATDDLGGDASLLKIGKHSPLICMGDGQGEDRFFLLLDRLGVGDGGVPGAASIELQQVVHRLPEILAAELLQKRDGVPARAVGVALPGPAVLDAEAVHLPGGVIPATQAADGVAQVFQQVRQVCPLGSLHLLVREFPEILWVWGSSRSSHLLWRKRKEAPRASR